jgi:protein-S-isoprenylcysteine O-methyltransferase Ste14
MAEPGRASGGDPGAQGQERPTRGAQSRTMIPGRERRRFKAESVLMRLVATAGVVGLGVLLGAILVSADVAGWIVGLVVALVSVVLAALLWSSRQL